MRNQTQEQASAASLEATKAETQFMLRRAQVEAHCCTVPADALRLIEAAIDAKAALELMSMGGRL